MLYYRSSMEFYPQQAAFSPGQYIPSMHSGFRTSKTPVYPNYTLSISHLNFFGNHAQRFRAYSLRPVRTSFRADARSGVAVSAVCSSPSHPGTHAQVLLQVTPTEHVHQGGAKFIIATIRENKTPKKTPPSIRGMIRHQKHPKKQPNT